MSTIPTAIFRDANRVPIQGMSLIARKSVTFAAATTGSIAAHTLFTVTDEVLVMAFAVVHSDLTSGGAATVSIGTANNVAGLVAVTGYAGLVGGSTWVDGTPGTEVEALPTGAISLINNGADIIYDVLGATVTGGVVDFYVLWRPLTEDSNLVVA
jgi:hypothetical protein